MLLIINSLPVHASAVTSLSIVQIGKKRIDNQLYVNFILLYVKFICLFDKHTLHL